MTCFINRTGEQATASATADPCGMTNKRTNNYKRRGNDTDILEQERVYEAGLY
jgi:hypothetical protein